MDDAVDFEDLLLHLEMLQLCHDKPCLPSEEEESTAPGGGGEEGRRMEEASIKMEPPPLLGRPEESPAVLPLPFRSCHPCLVARRRAMRIYLREANNTRKRYKSETRYRIPNVLDSDSSWLPCTRLVPTASRSCSSFENR